MTVVEHYGEDEKLLATALALCSDANVGEDGGAGRAYGGRPCQLCQLTPAPQAQSGGAGAACRRAPFDSGRKMMSTVHQDGQGYLQYTKGAPDEVLKRCDFVLEGGKAVPMTEEKPGRRSSPPTSPWRIRLCVSYPRLCGPIRPSGLHAGELGAAPDLPGPGGDD